LLLDFEAEYVTTHVAESEEIVELDGLALQELANYAKAYEYKQHDKGPADVSMAACKEIKFRKSKANFQVPRERRT
jgi:hypothetical protein